MKKFLLPLLILIFILTASFALVACDNNIGEETATPKAQTVAPEKSDVGPDYITVWYENNQEYTIAPKGAAPDWSKVKEAEEGQYSVRFEGLEALTVYTVYARAKATDITSTGEPLSTDIVTLYNKATYSDFSEGVVGNTLSFEVLNPVDEADLSYKWYVKEGDDGYYFRNLTLIENATTNTYTIAEGDLGKIIFLTVYKQNVKLIDFYYGPIEKRLAVTPQINGCDANSISIYSANENNEPIVGQEYVVAKKGEQPDWNAAIEADQNGVCNFANLDSTTLYTVYARIKATDGFSASEPVYFDYMTHIDGGDYPDVAIIGNEIAYVNDELENLSGVKYQWYRNEHYGNKYTAATLINGATSNTYTPTEDDLDKYLLLVVFKDGFEITSANIGPVYPKPIAPRLLSRSSTDITIECKNDNNDSVKDQEYVITRKGEQPDWSNAHELQESGVYCFEDLEPATIYTVFARIKTDDNLSIANEPLSIDFITSIEVVSTPENATVGERVAFVFDVSQEVTDLSYQWYLKDTYGGDYSEATLINNATYDNYVPTMNDYGKYLLLVVCKDEMEVEVVTIDEPVLPPIREDLQSLYDLLSAAGDKSINLAIKGNYRTSDKSELTSYDYQAILNILEGKGYQFALSDQSNPLVVYDGNILTVDEDTFDLSRLAQIVTSIFDGEGVNALSAQDLISSRVDTNENMDILTYTFVKISENLNYFDLIYPYLDAINVNAAKLDNVYMVSANACDLISILQNTMDTSVLFGYKIDIMKVVNFLDKQIYNDITEGMIQVNISFEITDNSLNIGLNIKNEKNGGSYLLNLTLTIDDELAELPSNEFASPKDIAITIPVVLPQYDVTATIDAVLHISDMFADVGKDYLTAKLTLGDNTLARFNLNDSYVYLDITGLVDLFSAEETSYTAFYYAPTDKNGDPVSVFDSLISHFANTSLETKYSEYNYGKANQDKELDIVSLLSRFRFFEDSENIKITVNNMIANFKAIVNNESNKTLFSNVFRFEKEDGGLVRIYVNNGDDVDLFAVLNLFVGIPTQNDGLVDVDESILFDLLQPTEQDSEWISSVKKTVSATLEGVISDLCVEVRGSTDDQFDVTLTLSNRSGENVYFDLRFKARSSEEEGLSNIFILSDGSGEKVYCNIGLGANVVPQVEQFALSLSAEEIENSLDDMSQLGNYAKLILQSITSFFEEVE